MPGLLRVHLVGHSLGCRVVLETVRATGALDAPPPVVGRMCLKGRLWRTASRTQRW
jgi:predicted alpha/beta hydrolase family esterase